MTLSLTESEVIRAGIILMEILQLHAHAINVCEARGSAVTDFN